VPLLTAEGAGAAGQQALGTAVFGGMIASTILAVFFVPVFFFILQSIAEWWKPMVPAEAVIHSLADDEATLPHEQEPALRRKQLRAASTH
jgi:hypothetical protein